MFNVGPGEIMIVGVLALVLFGPKKLPELGKALGQGLGNFKKSLTDAQSELKTALEVEEKQSTQEDSAKPQA
ncbi:MAG: twin-arginine translocase TatA/TatE family subunit [Candidatus Melainabacteria bacterium]|jgi:sec-independent protein translocase protein TatA|nr:MAG: twin-arginine translocase TatA/TatE family subunit [Candidatus Melainabacteria bacterium]